jgi:uncharacterized RDD family membrane protein YckC
MNWHYVEQGQQAGPVADEQLQKLFREGKINADTLVWSEGMANWIPFRDAKPEINVPPPMENVPNANEVVCAECGKIFPAGETIRYGKASVCAGCKPLFLQKLSEGAAINTGELNYAGFGIRLGAKLLDGLILGVPFMVVFFVIMIPLIRQGDANHKPDQVGALQLMPILIQLGFMLIQFGYQIFFLGKYGATPGKMICKLKVVTGEGGRFGYGRAAGRCLSEMLSGMICYIGYFMILFDDQKRALHDHICNTRVVYR